MTFVSLARLTHDLSMRLIFLWHDCNAFDLDVGSAWELLRCNACAARLLLAPVLSVHFVHSREILHVGQEDVDLHDILNGCPRCFKDVCKVLDALVRVSPNVTI